jgi:hypothetical protein
MLLILEMQVQKLKGEFTTTGGDAGNLIEAW